MPRERKPSDALSDARAFRAAITRFEPMDDAELRMGLAHVHPRELARGEIFLASGREATDVVVVVNGLLREYFVLADGTERTKAFVAEDELSGSLADLLGRGPSRAFIVADEPTRVLVAPFSAYGALAARSPAWERFSRRALEALLMRKAEREYELLGLDAEARYEAFALRYPGLEARVAARHVASYLGITPVHLSRLRRRRRERARADAKATRS